MSALAAIVDDRAWYAVDVYERRGDKLVKTKTYGPYHATHEGCRTILERIRKLDTKGEIICHRWDARQARWTRLT